MAEYIEREALLDLIDERNRNTCNGAMSCLQMKRMVDGIPAAEVESVRHGVWEQCFDDWRKQIEGDKCSACGFEHYGCSVRNYIFCPNCGARMDGGADNG